MAVPNCNHAYLEQGNVDENAIPGLGGVWHPNDGMMVPVAVCFRLTTTTKYAKVICNDDAAGSGHTMYKFNDKQACEDDADDNGSGGTPVQTGADKVVKSIKKGGTVDEKNVGMCDSQTKCVAGTDFFEKRMASGATCEATLFDDENKDWYPIFTSCLSDGRKQKCCGTGGWADEHWASQTSCDGTSLRTIDHPGNVCNGDDAFFWKYETSCTSTDGACGQTSSPSGSPTAASTDSGASSLKGKIVLGMVAVMLSAMFMM